MKTFLIFVACFVGFSNAISINKVALDKDDDKYCDALAKKCKSGNKEACDLYKKECGKVGCVDLLVDLYHQRD